MSEENIIEEIIPSMAEFEEELNRSFKKLSEGDIVKGTVIGISETELTIDLNYYAEGIVKLEEISNDPRFSIKTDVEIGEEVSAVVLREDRNGNILLSMKKAADELAWEKLRELKANRTVCRIKTGEAVPGGATAYIEGVRAFIPASRLALEYVEDTSAYAYRELDVIVAEVNENDKKVILSARDVERDKAAAEKSERVSKLQKGVVVNGTVEKLMPFGAFVSIGEDLSGLVHISQICGKRLRSPAEVLKVGDEVTVKIVDIKDGKISLSMTAVDEKDDALDDVEEAETSYTSGESAVTGLGDLLKGFKF